MKILHPKKILSQEAIALAVNGEDILRTVWLVFNLPAQPGDMNIDSARQGDVLIAPYFPQQLITREHDAFSLDQILQQPAFPFAKCGCLSAFGDARRGEIDMNAVEMV